jgi:hypothetical protein
MDFWVGCLKKEWKERLWFRWDINALFFDVGNMRGRPGRR